MVREPDVTMQPTLQDNQLMSKHRVLGFKPQLRLEWRGQDGQNETKQPDHSASLGDFFTSSTRIRFSVHTTARSSFAPTSFVLLSRAARKIALDRLSLERSRPDNLFPVKSASAATVAVASAASTSARVISAETISGDDRSTSRIMSCASVATARRQPSAAAPNARFIANPDNDV